MTVVNRSFSYERDLDSVRNFLSEIFRLTGSLHYLIPTKIENHKYGPCGPTYTKKDDEYIQIWQKTSDLNDSSQIIAISHRGPAGNYHIEIHPAYKKLERVIFHKIEDIERRLGDMTQSKIYMYTVEPDTERTNTLLDLQYVNLGLHEYNYVFPNLDNVPDYKIPRGYKIRNVGGMEDYPSLIEAIGSLYDHCATYITIERLKFMTQAQFYHSDLDLIAIAPTNEFVSFCTFRLDPLSKIAELENIGTKKNYRNLGLEEALICEGLSRLGKYQPKLVCIVELDISDELNDLISSIGFVKHTNMYMWSKVV